MYKLRDYSLRREQRLHYNLRQQVPQKAHYVVDLPKFMAECEANYLRLLQLTQNMDVHERRFLIERGELALEHRLTRTEQAKFTTTWCLEIISQVGLGWLKMPKITLRMYHDARLAEVIEWEGHRRFKPRYEYPNVHAFARDEKYQNNCFLGEWLKDCLANGLSLPILARH